MQNSEFESTKFPGKMRMNFRDKWLDFSTPVVMGIVNCTPDSFYSGSRLSNEEQIIERVKEMLKSGAQIIDVGGYSSRPNAIDISVEEEISRVVPAIEAIRTHFPQTIISLDTFRSSVAEAGINAGADLINDISGFAIDPAILDVVAQHKTPYILMHMRGTPQTMLDKTEYDDILLEMKAYFDEKLSILKQNGVDQIIIDLGFGFNKTIEQNHFILDNLEAFQEFNRPILLGISRKSMIYKKLGITPEESLPGTIALNAVGLSKGASILRVHDVVEATELIRLLS